MDHEIHSIQEYIDKENFKNITAGYQRTGSEFIPYTKMVREKFVQMIIYLIQI